MKKSKSANNPVIIIALHLGEGGVESYIENIANEFCKTRNVTILSVYKRMSDTHIFDKRIKISYLFDFDIAIVKKKSPLKAALHYLTRSATLKKWISKQKNCTIITTRKEHNRLFSRDNNSTIKIATEHNSLLDNPNYCSSVVKSLRNADYFVVPSKSLFDYYASKVSEPTKCIFIPHFLKELPSQKCTYDNKLVSMGRLTSVKGFSDLIDSFALIADKSPFELWILGEGEERQSLERQISQLGLEKKVKLPGFLGRSDYEKILIESFAFVSTSYSESFGLAALEAMSYGLPIICFSDAGGVAELTSDNDCGIVIKNRSKQELAKQILALSDKKLAKKLGEAAREAVRLKYLPDSCVSLWEDIL